MNYLAISPIEAGAFYFYAYMAVFVLISGSYYWLFWIIKKDQWQHRKSQHRPLKPGQVRREFLLSMRSLLLYSALFAINWHFIQQGYSQSYFSIEEYGWGWLIASSLLIVILHDAWFYWTHRLMHHKSLYRIMHKEHHRSISPTPWACYAFSIPEAIVQTLFYLLIVYLIPLHPIAYMAGIVILQWFNTEGHLGFENTPRWWIKWKIGGHFFNSSTHHDMHHEYFQGNYGLYTNFWDDAMNTNLPDYHQRLDKITEKPLIGNQETVR